MKVDRKYLIKMITEALIEDEALGEATRKPSPWVRGHIQGNRDARRLALKGEKQSAKGLRAYIQKATENHPNEKWREGYAFAFQLMFSAQLSDPVPDGQLPYANSRERPHWLFDPGQVRPKKFRHLEESDSGYTIEDLKGLLTDIRGYDYDLYAYFASLAPFILDEMREQLGVVEVIETDAGVPDIKIIFKDIEAAKNFASILQSAGLESSGPGHYKINKGMTRFKDHPKFHRKSLPSVKFNADHYYKGIEDDLNENESNDEFQKLMDLAQQEGEGNAMQAWEMHEYFDLTDQQIDQLRNIVAKEIIYNAEEPGRELIELGYDLHNEFTEVYGVTPPRDQEFVFSNGDTRLSVPLPRDKKLIFTFWFGGDNVDHPSDPWIFMDPADGSDEIPTIESPSPGKITLEIASKRGSYIPLDGNLSKEEVPEQIKKFTGWSESAGVNEKIDRNYLYKMINEVLREEEDEDEGFLENLFALVSSGNVKQAFEFADDLDMDKELLQRIVNDEGNSYDHGLTFAISDEGTVAIIDYALTRPELGDKIKRWLNDDKIGLPFTIIGKWDSIKGGYGSTPDYKMYRQVALLVFQNILANYDQFSDLNEENFGRESRGDVVLEEGWEDQWPSEFEVIAVSLKGSVGRSFQEAVSKVFLRTANISRLMPIRWVRAAANYSVDLSDSGMKLHRNKISTYERYINDIKMAPIIDFPQEEKDEQIKDLQDKIKKEKEFLNLYTEINSFAREAFYFGKQRRKEVLFQSRQIGKANPNSNMPSMRYINKTLKSIKKQLEKWRKKNTDGFARVNLTIGGILERLEIEFRNTALEVFNQFKGEHAQLFRYISNVRGTGEDAAKKLNAWLDKNKDLPLDEYEEGLRLFSVEQNKDYYKDCGDVPDGDPCVFLRLDNGMFWHSTETDYCEITQAEMSNCGSASGIGNTLYNLMSTSEGGSLRYHVTLEYNKDNNEVLQVLGKANTLPKEKYWPSITEFFNATGNPQLDKDAFIHLYDDEEDKETIDKRVDAFIQGIGVRTKPRPAIESWEAMKEQIREGYYTEKIETTAPINDQTNVFRVSLSYSGMTGPVDRPESVALITLNLQVILQTKETDKAEEWRKSNPNIFREAREFGESQEFKQLLYKAIPERITRPNRLDIKYSKISNPRLRLGGMGNYKMRMRISFEIDVRSWNESKGELLAMRFEELLQDTVRDLPGQAMLVFLAVEGKKKTNEGKIKLDRNYLTSTIVEVLGDEYSENNREPYHDMMLEFDDPESIIHGVYMMSIDKLGIFIEGTHEPFSISNIPMDMSVLQDDYIFEVDSKEEALKLQDALRDFYRPIKREIYIGADWYDGTPKVYMDIER